MLDSVKRCILLLICIGAYQAFGQPGDSITTRQTVHSPIGLLAFTIYQKADEHNRIPEKILLPHPRLLNGNKTREDIKKLVETEEWAKRLFDNVRSKVDVYVDRHQTDSTWIISRLQMYWRTHHTDVFIRGGVYLHAEGQAPVPTVRFPGTRDAVTPYLRPDLKDIQPYMDDERGLYLQNGSRPDKPWEYVEPSKTGRIIESINREIMGLAPTARHNKKNFLTLPPALLTFISNSTA